MTRDTQRSGEEVGAFGTLFVNELSLADRAAPTSQQPEDRGQKFPNSPDFPRSDRTQFRGWTAQVWMIIQQKPTSSPDEQSKMQFAVNSVRGVALGQILPHIREAREIGLEGLPAFIQLLEAAFGDPYQVTAAERKMREIKQKNCEFCQYNAQYKVIAANLDWNPLAL